MVAILLLLVGGVVAKRVVHPDLRNWTRPWRGLVSSTSAPAEGKSVLVLMFHLVDPVAGNDPKADAVTPDTLRADFQYLKDSGYHPISLAQFHAFLAGTGSVPEKAVLLTFDDGYEGTYTYAYPLTKEFHYPAVAFLVGKWFTPYPREEKHYPHLTTEQVVAMQKSGLWALGAHSYDLHVSLQEAGKTVYPAAQPLAGETQAQYRTRVWTDILAENAVLAGLQAAAGAGATATPIEDFAFPYGARSPEEIRLLQRAGYRYLYTTQPGRVVPTTPPTAIPRIGVPQTAAGFKQAVQNNTGTP